MDDISDHSMLAQLLLEQGKMSRDLAIANTKLDTIVTDTNDHETRIRALERVRWQMAGIGAFVGLIAAFLGWLGRGIHS